MHTSAKGTDAAKNATGKLAQKAVSGRSAVKSVAAEMTAIVVRIRVRARDVG